MKRYVNKLVTEITIETVLALVIFGASIFIFALIARETIYEHEDLFDQQVIAFFTRHRSAGLVSAMEFITVFGSSYFLLPAYIFIIIVLCRQRKFFTALYIFIISASSTLAMFWLKIYFHRDRPELPIIKGITNFSFPSGHSLSSFIFCSILIYLVWKSTWAKSVKIISIVLLLFFALTIGFSRIVLNVHYATDVIAGFCLGIIWVLASFYIFRKIHGKVSARQIVNKPFREDAPGNDLI